MRKLLTITILLLSFSAPAFGDIVYDQKLTGAKFICTHTSGKEVYDTGDIISLKKQSAKIKVTINGDTLTTVF